MKSFKLETVSLSKIMGLILLIIAWSSGVVDGALAWILLLLFIDLKINFEE
jgi:hypothetical protein